MLTLLLILIVLVLAAGLTGLYLNGSLLEWCMFSGGIVKVIVSLLNTISEINQE